MLFAPTTRCSLRQAPDHVALGRIARGMRAFTLTEILVSMSVFTMLVAGLIALQLMGMRMRTVTETKLAASASGRKALNDIRNQVRTAKLVVVGNGDDQSFKPIADRSPQVGNSLRIQATADTNVFTRYYLDPNTGALMRLDDKNRKPVRLASNITNAMAFAAEDFRGQVLTNSQNNRVIRMLFEFHQAEYPVAHANRSWMYDYFRLETRVTRRAID